mgnify:CR=1 FL=1
MTEPVVYTAAQQRLDIASVRHALHDAPAGPDLRRAQQAFERLLRRWAKSEDDTQEIPTP